MTSLVDHVAPEDHAGAGKICGVVIGHVTGNEDKQGMHMVDVKFPVLSTDDNDVVCAARVASPMAGNGRGAYFLPEVGDEVLVAFENGDLRFPYVVGSLWNGVDKPSATNSDNKNNIREIKSRCGAVIRWNDEDSNEKIEIIDKTGSNSITLNSSDNSITITCNGRMKLHANGIEITSDSDVKIQANSTMDINASAVLNVKGATVNIN